MNRSNRGRLARRSVASRSAQYSTPPIQPLEPRTFLNATLVTPLAPMTGGSSSSTTISLSPNFTDPSITGTTVEVQTPVGNIPIMLFDAQTPQTKDNFEHYIASGEYNNVIFHRSVPGFVLQGGGFTTSGTQINQFAPVPGEPGISNTTGTIAMALSTGPNSGTSEWFINLANNTALDTGDGGPFTVFGEVIYNGMSVVNAIAALPVVDVSSSIPAWSNLPVLNNNTSITAADLVTAKTVNVGALSYTATSDNSALVNPTVSGSNLVLNYGTQAGTANVTVTATDLGGNTAVSTFAVNVIPAVTIGNARGEQHSVRFTGANGAAATMTLAGPGTATVTLSGDGLSIATTKAGVATISGTPTSVAITTSGTTAASTLNVTGAPTIASITPSGDLGAFNGSKVALDGSLSATGSVGRVTLGSATGGAITVGGSARALTLAVGSASSEAVTSSEPIASLTATSWTTVSELGSPSTISAPSISRLSVTTTLNANVSTGSLGQATVGSITPSTWSVSGALTGLTAGSITGLNLSAASVGRLTDRGTASNLIVNSAGSITAVSALGFSATQIEAGNPPLDASNIPTAFPTAATIGAVTVGKGGFSNSVFGASTLGRVSLGGVNSANNGTPFGVASHDIVSMTVTVDGKRLSLARVTSADQVAAALSKAGITPNDFVTRIV